MFDKWLVRVAGSVVTFDGIRYAYEQHIGLQWLPIGMLIVLVLALINEAKKGRL